MFIARDMDGGKISDNSSSILLAKRILIQLSTSLYRTPVIPDVRVLLEPLYDQSRRLAHSWMTGYNQNKQLSSCNPRT